MAKHFILRHGRYSNLARFGAHGARVLNGTNKIVDKLRYITAGRDSPAISLMRLLRLPEMISRGIIGRERMICRF